MPDFSQYHVGPTVLPRITGANSLHYRGSGKSNARFMFELALLDAGYDPVPVGTHVDHEQVAWTLRDKPTGIDIQEGVKEWIQTQMTPP